MSAAVRRGVGELLVVLLVALLTLAVPGAATAVKKPPVPCPHATVVAHAEAASGVFTGTVTAVTAKANGAKNPDRKVTTYTHDVTVDRIYKGNLGLPADTDALQVVTTGSTNRCALGRLAEGKEYVFFTTTQQGILVASYDSGTALAGTTLVTTVQGLLGPGTDPTPPPPATATFTRVADSSPPSLSRLLAPGAALVIVGLLGLAVVGRMGRRA